MNDPTPPFPEATILALERPHPDLWKYYLICSILTGPALIVTLPLFYFRYHTLRYRFDAEGIHMRVGILFRREINLTYSRIQDIHLKSGFIQRWLGLANLEIQTASGAASAELVIEGFKEFEAIRDFLYTRMRGYQTRSVKPHADPKGSMSPADSEIVSLLQGIRDELRQTRGLLHNVSPGSAKPTTPPPHV
jgi:putative membrane protein